MITAAECVVEFFELHFQKCKVHRQTIKGDNTRTHREARTLRQQLTMSGLFERYVSLRDRVLRRKTVASTLESSTAHDRQHPTALKRALTLRDLLALGVGSIIGAGIFVLTGVAARDRAGPAVILSFLFAGLAALLSALSYSEFSARLPVSGSVFSYGTCLSE